MERLYISGETIDLMFEFFDLQGVPIDVTDVKLKAYDEATAQIGTTIVIDDSYKTGTGKYEIKYIIPTGEGQMYIQCSANNGNYEDIKRLEIKRTFYTDKSTVTIVLDTNSYATLEYANTFFSSRLNTDSWDFASDTDRCKALITATQRIDQLPIKGIKYLLTQPLEFPRNYGYSRSTTGIYYETNTVHEDVRKATCLLAIQLLTGESSRMKLQNEGVKSVSIGNVREDYAITNKSIFNKEVEALLNRFICNVVPIG